MTIPLPAVEPAPRMVDVPHEVRCLDCGLEIPGWINVSSSGPVGMAWLCLPCCTKYPTMQALRDRVTGASMRRLSEWRAPRAL